MKMTFRWYGSAIDPIPLKYVKQIPGMSGLMGLLDKPAGVDWPEEEVKELAESSYTTEVQTSYTEARFTELTKGQKVEKIEGVWETLEKFH